MQLLVLSLGIVLMFSSRTALAGDTAADCSATQGLQALVCGDPELADDERMLVDAFASAQRKAGEGLAALKSEQRTWSATRERCLSDALPWECVRDHTVRRTAALQARFRLVDASGQATFVCDSATRDLLKLEFFPTGSFTETAIARRGGMDVVLWLAPSASGSRYVAPGIQVWLAHGEALVRWGKGSAQRVCRTP
ncbi:MliC family protein [Paucibacter sp. R3-3]|uniref:MliC family protein n=1 Tax=Roseateles agri TaxID=3098619 RepID=A0ABU5DRY9_9BURK|nr:MliC family protein [Paucibacter sp. R3-3]MDY0749087.1 MliC family protein [Paucibacter sp. R3-3]